MKIIQHILAFLAISLLPVCLHAQQEARDFTSADSLINSGQFEKAIDRLNSIITNYGPKEKYLTNRAFAYLRLGNNEKAKADYRTALKLYPACAKCHGNLGIMESDTGNFDTALAHFNEYIKLEPGKAMGYVKRGEVENQTGKYDQAIADFDKALTIDINSPYIYLWRSMTWLSKGDAATALKDINESIKYKPEVEFAYYIRGKCYIKSAQYQLAWEDLAACLKKNATFSEYHTYAGIALYHLGSAGKAMEALNESIRLDGKNYLPYLYRSYILYENAQFDKACEDKSTSLSLVTGIPGQVITANEIQDDININCNKGTAQHYQNYRNKSNVFFNLGLFEQAAKILDEGLLKFPNDPALLNSRGDASMALGKFSDALINYQRSLENIDQLDVARTRDEQPRISDDQTKYVKTSKVKFTADVYNSIAFAELNLTHFDSALASIGKSIELLKDNLVTRNEAAIISERLAKRALIHGLLKHDKEAEQDINEALSQNPENTEALISRATNLINKNTIRDEPKPDIKAIFQPGQHEAANFSYATVTIKNWNREDIQNALHDCETVIKIDPANATAYMRKAQAEIILKTGAWCADLLKAKSLGVADAAKMLGVNCP